MTGPVREKDVGAAARAAGGARARARARKRSSGVRAQLRCEAWSGRTLLGNPPAHLKSSLLLGHH